MRLQPSWGQLEAQGLSQANADPPSIRSVVAPSHQGKLTHLTTSVASLNQKVRALSTAILGGKGVCWE